MASNGKYSYFPLSLAKISALQVAKNNLKEYREKDLSWLPECCKVSQQQKSLYTHY